MSAGILINRRDIGRNVEMIRIIDGAIRAPHEACLRQTSDPMIG
jgi:hypothetical protein